ncbi:hypothetical protein RMSM_00586 [Rhodopirellula maiorica SM1]|uniref:Uncharacterized protein n=1 Tax=Rhodopirellula maiorica SM1 TaxID=1265738 RepID=M5S4B3_9BACT|nr:hypothetical protein [Rhodopirellula maiorica]EMI22487.1 hypothetical protein RMSM_00586 [Rhodopirellula maiorica SM1]
MEPTGKRRFRSVAKLLAGLYQDRDLVGRAEPSGQDEERGMRGATAKRIARNTGTMTASEMLEERVDA